VTLTAAMPIALAGLGGLWSERAGVVNIGLEGMMIMGTLGAGYYGYHYGVIAGVVGATVLGMIGGALHALATVIFGVDHIVSGVAINIIAVGVAGFLAENWFSDLEGGGPTQSPPLPEPFVINIAFIADPAGTLEAKHWFLVSDLASVVEMFTKDLSSLVVFGLLLIVGTNFALWRTRFGLRLRSCGESPVAAETLGVNVYRYKIIAVVISGGLAGMGGALLAMVSSSGFQVGQTNGSGYIGLAAMIFGNWRPTGLFLGSALFGYTQALPFREGTVSLHALLLFIALLLFAVGIFQLRRHNRLQAAAAVAFGVVFLLWYLLTDSVPREFTTMAPYVTTVLVLALTSQRLRMPAADGQVYRRGSAG
jgi:simple sugar transport system permease protein